MSTTLLLDQSFQALGTINWQRAVTLLTLGKVEVIEEYDDRLLRSRTWIIKMPAVVRLVKAFRKTKRQEVKFSRHNILARDNFRCQYCNTELNTQTVTYDHVLPKSKGGKTSWENIVSCCSTCNGSKGSMTLKQAGLKLRKQPKKPSWVPIFVINSRGSVPTQWKSYLYWNTELQN